MADHPLKPATDRRLGSPLHHQQANQVQAHPRAPEFSRLVLQPSSYGVLAEVSLCCPPLQCTFPRVTHQCATLLSNSKLLNNTVQLACVKPAASVRSEPGSNSHIKFNPACHYFTLKNFLRFLNIQTLYLLYENIPSTYPLVLFTLFL